VQAVGCDLKVSKLVEERDGARDGRTPPSRGALRFTDAMYSCQHTILLLPSLTALCNVWTRPRLSFPCSIQCIGGFPSEASRFQNSALRRFSGHAVARQGTATKEVVSAHAQKSHFAGRAVHGVVIAEPLLSYDFNHCSRAQSLLSPPAYNEVELVSIACREAICSHTVTSRIDYHPSRSTQ